MTIPKPREETQQEFVKRFVDDDTMRAQFRDENERVMAAFEQWDKHDETPTREQRRLFSDKVEVRQEGKQAVLEGHAAVTGKLSEPIGFFWQFREIIKPGAFSKTLDDGDDVRALVDHDPSKIIGRTKNATLELREDDVGLFDRIEPPDTQAGRDIVTSIERGDVDQQSFGFMVRAAAWYEPRAHPSFPDEELEIRELLDIQLFDVSPVTFPAYTDTTIALRGQAEWHRGQSRQLKRLATRRTESGLLVPGDPDVQRKQRVMRSVMQRFGIETHTQKVQTLVFDKNEWTESEARDWMSANEFDAASPEHRDDSWRFRQFERDQCVAGTFQTSTAETPAGVTMLSCDTEG